MKLAIIHFQPLEQYPPAMNWLQYLAKRLSGDDRVVVLTRQPPAGMEHFDAGPGAVGIRRYQENNRATAISRYKAYFGFYLSALRQMKAFKPDTVLYYESLSALPALYYKYFVNRHCRLLVHYHEYTSPQEYRTGMVLNYRSHLLEKRLYPLFSGISHTNQTRLDLFTRDNPRANRTAQTVWPNFPPQSWLRSEVKEAHPAPLRFVYVGALSLDTMYVEAFAKWIRRQNGRCTWDIYSWNITAETKAWIEAFENGVIRLHEGMSYQSLPQTLAGFDIGVILYKGHIPNYVHNAPNKLFEYWSCGLDTWFPFQMQGALPYVTHGIFPRVIAVDFENLDDNPDTSANHDGLKYLPSPYNSEKAAETYFDWIVSHH